MADEKPKPSSSGPLLVLFALVFLFFWYAGQQGGSGQYGGGGGGGRERMGDNGALFEGVRIFDATPSESLQMPNSELLVDESQVDRLRSDTRSAQLWGARSPYEGMVELEEGGIRNARSDTEFVILRTSAGFQNGIDITGWTLESVKTGAQVKIPEGVYRFRVGELPTPESIRMGPNEIAYITTGESPTGVSFRENICVGFLGEFQEFTPALSPLCPTSSDTSVSCEMALDTGESYSACVAREESGPDFLTGIWRIYLNEPDERWSVSDSAIRLLDQDGKTVSVVELAP